MVLGLYLTTEYTVAVEYMEEWYLVYDDLYWIWWTVYYTEDWYWSVVDCTDCRGRAYSVVDAGYTKDWYCVSNGL